MSPVAFITGACGFIGRYAALEFARQGWQVVSLVHRAPLPPELVELQARGRLQAVHGDATRPASLRAALGGTVPTAIIHCAGRASDVGWRREFRRANLQSVENLVGLVRESGVGRLVFVSTTDVYGLRDFHGEGEDDLALDPAPRNPYPEFKIAAEALLRAGLPPERYAIIRPAAVWGPGDPTLTPRIVAFLRASPWIVHFGRWRGQNRWPLAHVRTVAATLYLAAARPEAAGRAIHVLDSERTAADEWYRLLAGIYLPGKTFRSITLPFWTGAAIGWPISAVSNALNLRRPFSDPSYYALRSVSANLDLGNQRMVELLAAAGCRPVARDEGLRELRAAAAEPRAVSL